MAKLNAWIAMYVDTGDTCDGKAHVLGVYNSYKEARNAVRNDIETWLDTNAREGVEVDFVKMRAYYDYDTSDGCEWSIEQLK